ncbi:MAG: Ig-like domain-containing protein [Bacteroidales bacterium]|nr:Ig-like domain-containing protein [Bacteroidales bacterium]
MKKILYCLAAFVLAFGCEQAPQTVAVLGVQVTPTSLKLKEGESYPLISQIVPSNATEKAIAWSSSDDKVATVNENGLVLAVGGGEAVITATSLDGGKTGSCAVKVTPSFIEVTEVKLNETTLTLEAGQKATLTATVSPADASDPTVSWSSSDETVATVADGVVLAVAAGTATITAKAGEQEATCEVTVTAKPEPEPTPGTIFFEDFEDISTLGEWSVFDADGDGNAWLYDNEGSWFAHSGTGVLTSASWDFDLGALTPDNWLFTPGIPLTNGTNYLSFWVCGQDPDYCAEHYGAFITDEAPTPENLGSCVPLMEETFPEGAPYAEETVTSEDGDALYQQFVIEIPASFSGKTVYIGFRHFDCTDNFYLNLDDVAVLSEAPASQKAAARVPARFSHKKIRRK